MQITTLGFCQLLSSRVQRYATWRLANGHTIWPPRSCVCLCLAELSIKGDKEESSSRPSQQAVASQQPTVVLEEHNCVRVNNILQIKLPQFTCAPALVQRPSTGHCDLSPAAASAQLRLVPAARAADSDRSAMGLSLIIWRAAKSRRDDSFVE